MQDEVTKHGRKIYRAVKDRRHNTGEKIKDILIEIAIIVFAVSLSIWLHGWSEHRHERKEVREFLTGLKSDLTEDIRLLEKTAARQPGWTAVTISCWQCMTPGRLPLPATQPFITTCILIWT